MLHLLTMLYWQSCTRLWNFSKMWGKYPDFITCKSINGYMIIISLSYNTHVKINTWCQYLWSLWWTSAFLRQTAVYAGEVPVAVFEESHTWTRLQADTYKTQLQTLLTIEWNKIHLFKKNCETCIMQSLILEELSIVCVAEKLCKKKYP